MGTQIINKRDVPGIQGGRGQIELLVHNKILTTVNTSLIGVIDKFYPDTQTCDVTPIQPTKKSVSNANTIEYIDVPARLIPDVPVQFPSGGGFTLTFPIKRGDECILIFNQRPIKEWVASNNGGIQEDAGIKNYSERNAIAIVGINAPRTVENALPSINADEPELRTNDGSVKLRITTGGIEIDGNLDVGGDITATGNIEAQGDVKAGTVSLMQHTHPAGITVTTAVAGTVGTGATTAPTSPPTP